MGTHVPKRVLIIVSDRDYRNLLVRFLKQTFADLKIHEHDPSALGRPDDTFDWSIFDVLLLDYRLGENESGLDWLRQFKQESASFPATILLTGGGSEDLAVRALRHGAHDYLRKRDVTPEKLKASISDAFHVRDEHTNVENSLTLSASRFSKSFFYQRFELAFDEAERGENRALALVRTDGDESLRESLGLIAMDRVARHLTSIGLSAFRIGGHIPRATLFGDSSIAFIVGGFRDNTDLQSLLASFCDSVKRSPPLIKESEVPITVSIGAVLIQSRATGVDLLFERVESALKQAAAKGGDRSLLLEPGSDDDGLDTIKRAQLFDARQALKENRVQPMFWPLMAVSGDSSKLGVKEFFELTPRFVAHNGRMLPVATVLSRQSGQRVARLADRWKLRECVGRALTRGNAGDGVQGFLLGLGEASCADAKLAGWVDELIKHYGGRRKLSEICISLSPTLLMRHPDSVVKIGARLRDRHGFRLVLNSVSDAALCKACFAKLACDLIILSEKLIEQIVNRGAGTEESDKLLSFEVKRGALSIARGIEDADALHAVISAGVDFAQGEFVAPEQEEIDISEGVESVRLG